MFANRNIDLRQEGYPAEDVLAEVAHGAAGERGVRVDVLVVVEPLGELHLENIDIIDIVKSFNIIYTVARICLTRGSSQSNIGFLLCML